MELSMATFQDIRGFIYERSGIFFAENKKYVLEGRLLPRLQERNCGSYEEYYELLRLDAWRDNEISALYNLVTNNETYFYRDEPQLNAFIETIVPAVKKAKEASRQLKLWSAACSTGDEPYTLAILLLEQPALMQWSIEILASDLSENVLRTARRGVYGTNAVRNVPPAVLMKYFTVDAGVYTVAPKVKSIVTFANLNLYDSVKLKLIRGVDVIFCRNCLIYFDDKAKEKIIGQFYDCLNPNGYLVIGFSESLHNITRAFRPLSANRSVVYQKM